MLHKYGICSMEAEKKGYLKNIIASNTTQASSLPNIHLAITIQHFGDYSSDCYYPHRDLLIPPK